MHLKGLEADQQDQEIFFLDTDDDVVDPYDEMIGALRFDTWFEDLYDDPVERSSVGSNGSSKKQKVATDSPGMYSLCEKFIVTKSSQKIWKLTYILCNC